MAEEPSTRTYHGTAAPYMLPNDPTDHERLTMQHHAIIAMMHNKPIQAPLSNPTKILDVGCGTGIQTRYFATAYPSATEVIGLDLSPVPEDSTTPTPPQVSFIQGEFHALAASANEPRISLGSFDFIYSQMLVFGMTDWPQYIAKARDLLAPGGWLEMHDLDLTYFDGAGREQSRDWTWLCEQRKAVAEQGLDLQGARKLEGYLKEAGFVDVQARMYRWAFALSEDHPETADMVRINQKYNLKANAVALRKILQDRKEPAELNTIIDEMTRDLGTRQDGGYFAFWVVSGRKS